MTSEGKTAIVVGHNLANALRNFQERMTSREYDLYKIERVSKEAYQFSFMEKGEVA